MIHAVILPHVACTLELVPYLSYIYLSLHRVPEDVGSANKFRPCISILGNPVYHVESGASHDVIFPSLPRSSLSVCARDSFHENAFGMAGVVHTAYMSKPGQLRLSDSGQDPL